MDKNGFTPSQFGESRFIRIPVDGIDVMGENKEMMVPFLQETNRLQAGMECNFFDFEKFTIENGEITLDVEISMTNVCRDIKMWAQLYDSRDESKPIASYEVQERTETDDMHYLIHAPVITDADDAELEVVVNVEWQDKWGNCGFAAIKESAAYDLAEWNVIYPKIEENKYILFKDGKPEEQPVPEKEKSQDDKILIALFREPDDTRDLDYLCEYGKDAKGEPFLMIPGSGKIIFKDSDVVIEKDKATMVCYLKKINQGGVHVVAAGNGDYRNDNIEIKYSAKAISYTMYDSCGVGLIEAGNFERHEFSYRIDLTYRREGMKTNRTLKLADDVDHRHCIQSVPHILIMWGCVEEKTRIQMADGTQKEIRNIRIGDVVQLANGKIKWVENVWRGPEDSWYLLRTRSGMEIKASNTHPFFTKRRRRTGMSPGTGDVVTVWDEWNFCMQEETLSEVKKVEERIIVYNLSLGGNQMIANGFVCGDMELQNQC